MVGLWSERQQQQLQGQRCPCRSHVLQFYSFIHSSFIRKAAYTQLDKMTKCIEDRSDGEMTCDAKNIAVEMRILLCKGRDSQ